MVLGLQLISISEGKIIDRQLIQLYHKKKNEKKERIQIIDNKYNEKLSEYYVKHNFQPFIHVFFFFNKIINFFLKN